jgi:hypothetical protein
MFVVIALFVRQYCRWIGLWSVYNTWKLVRHHTRHRKLADSWKFLLLPPQQSYRRRIVLKHTKIFWFEWCIDRLSLMGLHIVMNAQILGVEVIPFLHLPPHFFWQIHQISTSCTTNTPHSHRRSTTTRPLQSTKLDIIHEDPLDYRLNQSRCRTSP